MKKTYKTIRVSADTYENLIDYRAEQELHNRSRVSFDEAIDMMFGEIAGLDYEVTSQRQEIKQLKEQAA